MNDVVTLTKLLLVPSKSQFRGFGEVMIKNWGDELSKIVDCFGMKQNGIRYDVEVSKKRRKSSEIFNGFCPNVRAWSSRNC